MYIGTPALAKNCCGFYVVASTVASGLKYTRILDVNKIVCLEARVLLLFTKARTK